MLRRLTLPQLKKYDVTQKVIETLADSESRAILFSTIKKGHTAADLSYKLKIPLSSVYKKLAELEELTLIRVEKWMMRNVRRQNVCGRNIWGRNVRGRNVQGRNVWGRNV